jgi:hypothetical protein
MVATEHPTPLQAPGAQRGKQLRIKGACSLGKANPLLPELWCGGCQKVGAGGGGGGEAGGEPGDCALVRGEVSRASGLGDKDRMVLYTAG